MSDLLRRIKDWWRGYYQPPSGGGVDDPPICRCGHYFYVHEPHGCFGWARDQWAQLGQISFNLRCRCKFGFHRLADTER